MSKSQRRGFTLVELLVVIGIIALLISVLMPSLSRARMSANLVTCQANFRQVYTALQFYTGEWNGTLPRASDNNWGSMGTNAGIYIKITQQLSKPFADENKDTLHPVLNCVESPGSETAWAPNLVRSIQFNPRAFPGYDQLNALPNEFPQRKLASIRQSSEKIMFYEGPQIPAWNMCPEPEAIFLDGWRWNWGHMYADPPADGDVKRWNQPLDYGKNRDDGWWVCSMRFRHNKNTSGPIAFFDGHVENRRVGDVYVREVCINR